MKKRMKVTMNPTTNPIIKGVILAYIESGANAILNSNGRTYLIHPTKGRLDVTGQINVMQ